MPMIDVCPDQQPSKGSKGYVVIVTDRRSLPIPVLKSWPPVAGQQEVRPVGGTEEPSRM